MTTNDAEKLYEEAMDIRFQNPDAAIEMLERCFLVYSQEKDTVQAIQVLLDKAELYETTAKYARSYDALWQAMILIDRFDNKNLKSVVYNRLGRIYSYYKREEKSLEYLKKALENHKQLVESNEIDRSELVSYYYSIVSTYRELNQKELGMTYLDSCYMYFDDSSSLTPRPMLDFEKAFFLSDDNIEKSLEIMFDILPWYKENLPSYLVLFYKYLGDIYLNMSDFKNSEKYYLLSLSVSEEYNSHIDFTPLVYQKLADLYVSKKDYQRAFENLEKAKELDAVFFDSRSAENQSHLEIKDSYRIEKERQEDLIQEQRINQLKLNERLNNLQNILLIGSLIVLVLFGFLYVKHLRSKHKAEKKLINAKKELEIKKAQELLELKNKELATQALQLIEKDEFLRELKSTVRSRGKEMKINDLNKLLRSVSVNNSKNWDEFRMRFIEVNKGFYDEIFKRFPNLSQGDQKICALIKLNFSSKEMARLLGISVESVHTNRHRIRKKMNLPRNVNFEEFINSL